MAHTVEPRATQFLGHASRMLATHPSGSKRNQSALVECIQACFDCAQACIACADACLGESDPANLVRCIRLNQDCADICTSTGRVLSRQTAPDAAVLRAMLHACAIACRTCAEECGQHAARMEHCRVCEEACRQCERACQALGSVASA
jgi:uncharacterized membrane protein